jgi:hypothetical protein
VKKDEMMDLINDLSKPVVHEQKEMASGIPEAKN